MLPPQSRRFREVAIGPRMVRSLSGTSFMTATTVTPVRRMRPTAARAQVHQPSEQPLGRQVANLCEDRFAAPSTGPIQSPLQTKFTFLPERLFVSGGGVEAKDAGRAKVVGTG
jgi:hypothetical protein